MRGGSHSATATCWCETEMHSLFQSVCLPAYSLGCDFEYQLAYTDGWLTGEAEGGVRGVMNPAYEYALPPHLRLLPPDNSEVTSPSSIPNVSYPRIQSPEVPQNMMMDLTGTLDFTDDDSEHASPGDDHASCANSPDAASHTSVEVLVHVECYSAIKQNKRRSQFGPSLRTFSGHREGGCPAASVLGHANACDESLVQGVRTTEGTYTGPRTTPVSVSSSIPVTGSDGTAGVARGVTRSTVATHVSAASSVASLQQSWHRGAQWPSSGKPNAGMYSCMSTTCLHVIDISYSFSFRLRITLLDQNRDLCCDVLCTKSCLHTCFP